MQRKDGHGLAELHAAIQTFSNDMADTDEQVGMVAAGLVVWTEVTYGDDGEPQYQTIYAATGDQSNPNVSLGLALNLLTTLKRDVVGFE